MAKELTPQQVFLIGAETNRAAAGLIADVIRDACVVRAGDARPSGEDLKKLAEDAGQALAAGLKKFSEGC